MKARINWIDWAKAWAATTVVFCHLPQSPESFYFRYLQAVIISIFFFISGYLKRDRGSDRANWQKYWSSLVVPYLLFNALIYPYWLLKFYVAHGTLPGIAEALRPVVGTLLLQHSGSFAEPLDGPLWYLPAILMMHVAIDLCRKTRHQHLIMIVLCVVSFVLYAANKYWYFAPDLTPMGVMRNLPYYYIGYVMGQQRTLLNTRRCRDAAVCLACLAASVTLFAWHLQAFYAGEHLLHIVLFYPVNIGFFLGVVYGCKVLGSCPRTVVTLSEGTLIVIGLHIVVISFVNAAAEHLFGLHTTICYAWYEAAVIALAIVALLYPLIPWAKRHFTTLLGKRQPTP